jgi:general secretion pathway protein H
MPPPVLKRRSGGFTLIEILVVLGVLGLALALIVSYGSPPSGGLALRKAAGDLEGGLREARSLAIAGNRTTALVLDLAARRWRVGSQPDNPLPEGIEIRLLSVAGEATGGNRAAFRFWPDGSATGGRIELIGANRKTQIGVDWLSGRISQSTIP